jgi:membrane fusion protein (multidrug efflux system)
VSAGAYLKIGDPIADLARSDAMKVSFSAPRALPAAAPAPASQSISSSPAVPGRVFTGTITVVEPIVNAGTRTVQILARIPNPHGLLRPGLSADVAVTFAARTNAMVVPDEAIFAEGNQSFVYVVNPDSTVSRKAVRLGTRDSMRVEVIEGLAPDQLVVSAGHQKIFEGAHVMPIMDQPPAGPASGGAPGAQARPATQGAAATAGAARDGGAATTTSTRPKGGSAKDSP